MNSSRPYVIEALISWIVDNGCTPHVVIDTNVTGCQAPLEFAKNGKLTLNVSGTAVRNFHLNQECLSFDARFGGRSQHVNVPTGAVIGVYAKENGEGLAFPTEVASEREQAEAEAEESVGGSELPSYLKLVKE